jgi:hypothetical protein
MPIKIILLLVLTILFQEEELVWKKERLLTWSDFKAKAKSQSPAAAVTASGLTYNFSLNRINGEIKGFEAKVVAHFYPQHSWCKHDEITDYILSHEQFHFNITELHARLLRKALTQLKPNSKLEAQINQAYKKINTDLASMQRAYDSETSYSRNYKRQDEWEEKIIFHINLLNAYKL